jgi:hypothetical protein
MRSADSLLGVLDDSPDGLTELRRALTKDHRWRMGQGDHAA